MRLGKTQVAFEEGYYVMDLLDVMDAAGRVHAERALEQLNTAVMAQGARPEDFRSYADALLERARGEQNERPSCFDEAGFQELKQQLRNGR